MTDKRTYCTTVFCTIKYALQMLQKVNQLKNFFIVNSDFNVLRLFIN